MKKIILGLLLIVSFGACKKLQNGYQSDAIRYKDKNILAVRGLIVSESDRINTDGSTPPYKFKMLNLRKADGTPAPKEFTTPYDIVVFKPGQSFDPDVDVTAELLNAKRETKSLLPMYFNESSGQFVFNRGSGNLPLGKYDFDIEMTNKTKTTLFPALGTINVVDPSIEDLFVVKDNVSNAFNDATGTPTQHKNPIMTCTKISNEGARVILKMVDKNNRVFNPKAGEIIQRGDRPTFESYSKFHPIIKTDTAMICDFEIAPFPLKEFPGYGYLVYYRIPSMYATVDNFPASLGTFSVNPRWSWQLKLEGTYIVQIKFSDVTHK